MPVNRGSALRAYGRAFRLHPPTALGDWKHILLAFFSLLGIAKSAHLV